MFEALPAPNHSRVVVKLRFVIARRNRGYLVAPGAGPLRAALFGSALQRPDVAENRLDASIRVIDLDVTPARQQIDQDSDVIERGQKLAFAQARKIK